MSYPGQHPPYAGTPKQRLYGVYPALVVDVADPKDQGRVQIELPWVDEEQGQAATAWARLATMMAGEERGSWFIPEPRDEVLVSFVAGDPSRPIVTGALWNGADAPPEQMDAAGDNNQRSITSRSGHRLRFDDTAGDERVDIETSGGHRLTFDDGEQMITLEHSNGTTIEVDATGNVTIRANSEVRVRAPAGMKVTAAKVEVQAAMSRFSGVVQADSVITNSVVSPSYTSGVGNVW